MGRDPRSACRISCGERLGPFRAVATNRVFFDLDGTLTDPMPGITGCVQYALQRLGEPVPEAQELTWCIGPPLLDSLARLVGDERAPMAVAHYRERFADVGLYENALYPGIVDMLQALAAAGTRMFVASSKPEVFVRRIVEHFEIGDYFSAIFGSELDGTRVDKSDLLRFALTKTRAPSPHTTMVGDREHDVIGARNNGLHAVGVLYGYGSVAELESAGVDNLANTPADLVALLL